MKRFLTPILVDRTQGQQSFGSGDRPAHAREFHAVFDQMPTRAFDHSPVSLTLELWHLLFSTLDQDGTRWRAVCADQFE
ncbi:MAG TPA: hypothetical protein VI793_02110, partial [Anaerolineales bacterium]|nr:hypothetical protein [Anaerolineales bacterium]